MILEINIEFQSINNLNGFDQHIRNYTLMVECWFINIGRELTLHHAKISQKNMKHDVMKFFAIVD